LRPGIRYSNGRPVKASDVRSTFERDFRLETPAPYYEGIVGVDRCRKTPKRCDLSRGIVTDDEARTVTFHLVAPDSEFLYKLALPFVHLVPPKTPMTASGVPGTGPYTVSTYSPKRVIKLVRNPHFREWSRLAQPDGYPDEIVLRIGGTTDAAIDDVLRGKADLFTTAHGQTPPSASRVAEIRTQYASQVYANPQPATVALFLNTRIPPFDRLDVRRALNYAADRAAAIEAAGGPDFAQATCQILPPSFPGYKPYCPFTRGATTKGGAGAPDLARARDLISASGTRGMKVTVWSWQPYAGVGRYAATLLRSLGYDVSVKTRGGYEYFDVVGDPRTKPQIGITEWISDYPTAYGFVGGVLTCDSYVPGTYTANYAEFCDPKIDRQMQRALDEQPTNPNAARVRWEGVDRQLVDQAPWLPVLTPKALDVVSKRVGNYQYSPAGVGLLIDQLWVQ
jgi:peptide/nickel transport system substrate-binding protein